MWELVEEVSKRIAKATRAYGALLELVFVDRNLSLRAKRTAYRAVVLGDIIVWL